MPATMEWKLWLDDIRPPPDTTWVWAQTVRAAQELIQDRGCPPFISFDHDLGVEPPSNLNEVMTSTTAMTLAKWLIDKDLDNPGFVPSHFGFAVHSANPVGADNLRSLLGQFLDVRSNGETVR